MINQFSFGSTDWIGSGPKSPPRYEILLPLSVAITPDLLTTDSLIMRDEHLRTIPEKESDEFIKSSVEDLVPIPNESEDTSESDSDCDLSFCDDFWYRIFTKGQK
ncbi:hypothetical protein Tco_0808314 [Tanacetum coccineum]